MEATLKVTLRVRCPDDTPDQEIIQSALEHVHGSPGYVLADARVLAHHEDHTPCPHPLDAV